MKRVLLVMLLASLPPSLAAEELVPDLAALEVALGEAEALANGAVTLERTLSRVQNAFHFATGSERIRGCPDEAVALAARSRALGQAARDLIQSARAASRRARRVFPEPTVAPLVDERLQERADRLSRRLDGLIERWMVAAAWQARFVEPLARRCPLTLTPGPGLPSPGGREGFEPQAVLVVGEGRLCSAGPITEMGVVRVVRDGRACLTASSTCDCRPRTLLAAQVLGL